MEKINFEISFKKEMDAFSPRNSVIKNLEKILYKDSLYLNFVSAFKSQELNADMVLLDYEQALNKNRYIQRENKGVSEVMWMIAESGQGDEWFAHLGTLTVHFYDHNNGEYQIEKFINFDIDFNKFIVLGLTVRKLETYLDDEIDERALQSSFAQALNKIRAGLYDIYPYDYFQ